MGASRRVGRRQAGRVERAGGSAGRPACRAPRLWAGWQRRCGQRREGVTSTEQLGAGTGRRQAPLRRGVPARRCTRTRPGAGPAGAHPSASCPSSPCGPPRRRGCRAPSPAARCAGQGARGAGWGGAGPACQAGRRRRRQAPAALAARRRQPPQSPHTAITPSPHVGQNSAGSGVCQPCAVPTPARRHPHTGPHSAGSQRSRGVELGEVGGLAGPLEDREGEEAGGEPGVQHVLVLCVGVGRIGLDSGRQVMRPSIGLRVPAREPGARHVLVLCVRWGELGSRRAVGGQREDGTWARRCGNVGEGGSQAPSTSCLVRSKSGSGVVEHC